jgi:hypothetical protein
MGRCLGEQDGLGPFLLDVVDGRGDRVKVYVTLWNAFADVKAKIVAGTRDLWARPQLMFNEEVLEVGRSLTDYSIEKGLELLAFHRVEPPNTSAMRIHIFSMGCTSLATFDVKGSDFVGDVARSLQTVTGQVLMYHQLIHRGIITRYDPQLWNFNIENESVVLLSLVSGVRTFEQMGM